MIVVDASAIVAIVEREPDAAVYAEALEAADAARLSAASLVEPAVVLLRRHGEAGWTIGRRFLDEAGIGIGSRRGWRHAPSMPIAPTVEGPASTSATASPTRWRWRRSRRSCVEGNGFARTDVNRCV